MRLIALACVVLAFSSGCVDIVLGRESVRGSGSISVERHRFTGLTGVELATRGELEIRLGDDEGLQIAADDNLHEYFALTTDGGTLTIDTRPGFNLRPSRPIRYTLTAREIEFIELSSSGDARAPDLRADRLDIRLNSSGDLSVGDIQAESVDVGLDSSGDLSVDDIQAEFVDISVDSSGDLSVGGIEANVVDVRMRSSGDVEMDGLQAGSLTVGINSSGDIRIREGEVDNLDLTINSSGDYRGASVRSVRATVGLNSTGGARLWVEESLDAELNSAGSVSYRGDPEVRERSNSTGRVRPMR